MALVAPHHVLTRRKATIVDLDASISKTSDEDVAGDLIAREGGQARVGTSREVLREEKPSASMARRASSAPRQTHLQDRLPRRIPDADELDIASHQRLSATLLPFDDKSSIVLFGGGRKRL